MNGVVHRNKKESKTTLKYNVAESLVSRILVEYEPCSYKVLTNWAKHYNAVAK